MKKKNIGGLVDLSGLLVGCIVEVAEMIYYFAIGGIYFWRIATYYVRLHEQPDARATANIVEEASDRTHAFPLLRVPTQTEF